MERDERLGIIEFKEVLLDYLDFSDDFLDKNYEKLDNLLTFVYNIYYSNEVTSIIVIAKIILLTLSTINEEI